MKPDLSVSVIIPAFNEAGNIELAVMGVKHAVHRATKNYEILVVNDGSKDATGSIADKIAREYTQVRVIHLSRNSGLAVAFLTGVRHARKEYITAFHGDNDADPSFLTDLILAAYSADVISIYPVDSSARPWQRRIVSNVFVGLMNLLFGMRLRYYNGTFIVKRKIIEELVLASKGFTIYAEIKIRLIRRGYTFREIPFKHRKRLTGQSTAVSFKNILMTGKTLGQIVSDIYIKHQP